MNAARATEWVSSTAEREEGHWAKQEHSIKLLMQRLEGTITYALHIL